MTKSEFDKIFEETSRNLVKKYTDKASLKKIFEEHIGESRTITPDEMSNILFIESVKYSNALVHGVLTKVLELND